MLDETSVTTSGGQALPGEHRGIFYHDFMSTLSEKRNTKFYLEIGVDNGDLLSRIHADLAVGVDPKFNLHANVCAKNKKCVHLHQCTSDEFFASQAKSYRKGDLDLVFIDGYHTFEYLLRDFLNVERISSRRTLVALHDALPLDDVMVVRRLADWKEKTAGTKFAGWWTGDVWKTVSILQKHRPDLSIVYADCPPTGVVFVTNLDPTNTYLSDNYLDLVTEYSNVENDINELERFYSRIEFTQSAKILVENDHSLYFRI